MKPIKKLPSEFLIFCIVTLIFVKIIFHIFVKNNFLVISSGGANDADYYHGYALGSLDIVVNIWPVILRYLNYLGIYSRDGVSYFLLFLNLLVIPIIVAKLSGLKIRIDQQYYLYSFLLCLLYPTVFFYTFDVYRDVFMVFSFLLACCIVKKCLNSSNVLSFSFFFILSFSMGLFLLGLRPYLGYAFLLSLFLWKIKFTKKKLIFFAFLYFLVIFVANYLGFLNVLTEYRNGFEETEGGSNLGLSFSDPLMFIPNFIFSMLGQLFGLYIINPFAIVLLLVETVPFYYMLVYIIKNIKLADNFVRFLIIFFIIYASVWLIGNDNLGTALRLRFYNYFSVYICFFYILRFKKLESVHNN